MENLILIDPNLCIPENLENSVNSEDSDDPDGFTSLIDSTDSTDLNLLNDEIFFIRKWKLIICYDEKIGKFLTTEHVIPAAELVMELKPKKLLTIEEIINFQSGNQVIQVSPNLFSSSEHCDEYNNFICHSCDPNCCVFIQKDYTIQLTSTKFINPGDPITFNYNTTEYDLIKQGCDFYCNCESPNCVKWIRGYKYLKNL